MTHVALKSGLVAVATLLALGGAASAQDARHGNWQGQRKTTTTTVTTSRPTAVTPPVTTTRTTTVTQRTATAPSWVGSRPHQESFREPVHGRSDWRGGHGDSRWGHGWRGWRHHWGWW